MSQSEILSEEVSLKKTDFFVTHSESKDISESILRQLKNIYNCSAIYCF